MSDISNIDDMIIHLKTEGFFELNEQKIINSNDNSESYINLKGVTLKDNEDTIIGYLIVEDDITKLIALGKEKKQAITEATKKFSKTNRENLSKILEQQLEIQELKSIIINQKGNIKGLSKILISLDNANKINILNENKALNGKVKSLETKYKELVKKSKDFMEIKRKNTTRNSKLDVMITKLSNIEKGISTGRLDVGRDAIKNILVKSIKMLNDELKDTERHLLEEHIEKTKIIETTSCIYI